MNSNENYSPGKPGAQSVAPSPAELNKKLKSANDLDDFLKTDFNTDANGGYAQSDIKKSPCEEFKTRIDTGSKQGDYSFQIASRPTLKRTI